MEINVYNSLLELVRGYFDRIDLVERYAPNRYGFNIDNCPVEEFIKDEIRVRDCNYDKNIFLKNRLSNVLEGRVNNQDLNFWIINEWGGIRSFGRTKANQNRIEQFFNLLEGNHLCGMKTIASLSKVVSFVRPRQYFVYDSRIAYSLNWLLRQAGAREGFFPIPPGQSSLAKKCDLKGVLDSEGRLFQNADYAYFDYCQVIQRLYHSICPKGDEPFRIEMLLFQLAPCEIKEAFINEFQGTPFFCTNQQDNDDREIEHMIPFHNCSIKGRLADYGVLHCFHGRPLYVFVGRTSRSLYCKLFLTQSNMEYPYQRELLDDGFLVKGGRTPYLVRHFPIGQEESARECYENVLSLLFE